MWHISTVRYLAAIAMVPLVMGGAMAIHVKDQPATDQVVQKFAAPSAPQQIDPAELHGEIPNMDPIQRSTNLAEGEQLGSNIGKVVVELEPALSVEQIDVVVNKLLEDIREDTGVADLDNLSPGVTVTIFRHFNDRGEHIWTAYAGKNSGIEQNAK